MPISLSNFLFSQYSYAQHLLDLQKYTLYITRQKTGLTRQGLRIRKGYCTNDDIQSIDDNAVRTSVEVPLK